MPAAKGPGPHVPVKLTEAQRKSLAELLPGLADRLRLDERGQKTISFTPAELNAVVAKAATGLRAVAS